MKPLEENWFVQKSLDTEYNQYILLAYLQMIQKSFRQVKLFPFLDELHKHEQSLKQLIESKKQMDDQFPKDLQQLSIDDNWNLSQMNDTGDPFEKIEEIIHFALPKIKNHIQEGTELLEMVKDWLVIEPIGLLPVECNEGYMFLSNKSQRKGHVFQYSIGIIENKASGLIEFKTKYIQEYPLSLSNTYEKIKLEIIEKNEELPNPATYAVEVTPDVPLYETYLPLAKHVLIHYIE